MRLTYGLIIAVLLYFAQAAASQAQSNSVSLPVIMGSKQVLVIGESYGHTESAEFFSKTVTEYLNNGGCIKVGLEISSDQQATLDSAMKGEVPVSELKINDIVDSPAYRRMLTDLSGQVRAGKCLSVSAIDAPASVPVTRDAWMEKQVTALTGDTPVILLVGNVRAVKDTGAGDSGGLLAERMSGKMPAVASVLQYWTPGQCENRTVEYINAEDERAGVYLKETVKDMTPVMPATPTAIADGVLVWSCESENVTEKMNIDDSGKGESVKDQVGVTMEKTETVVRDEKALKKIKWGMKNEYPAIGMTKDEALQAMGEPENKEDVNGVERWSYQCFDEDGYWHTCFTLDFKDDIVVKFLDLE
ncbi:MAG TPA: hypothetical protein VFJ67_00225 [Thermodesulfobacteriota bacterium]|nr:hypothetical protein [Thermodesulfobacteriota bacterium]